MSAEADMHLRLIRILGTLLIGVSTAAVAQNAITVRPLNVHAGPDRAYPLVAQLDAGTPVDVMGCLSDWSWCDVTFDGTRGWAYAPGLTYLYQGQDVPLYAYAPGLGIPVVTFSIGPYWDHYYRGRPWFGQRAMWMHRRLPEHRRPPGPAPSAQLPPLHAQAGRPGTARPQHGIEATPRHGAGAPTHLAERNGNERRENTERDNTERPQRAPSEPRERAPAERAPSERAPNERASSERKAPDHKAPDQSKREPPPG
jgi:uncharacterized protein YraI